MEQQRSKKAKSLRAAGRKPVNNNLADKIDKELVTHCVRSLSKRPVLGTNATFCTRRRFFQIATVAGVAFTPSDIFNQFLVTTNTAGLAVPFVGAVRMKKVTWYCNAALAGATSSPASVTVTLLGRDTSTNYINSPDKTFLLESIDGKTASMSLRFGRQDPCGVWYIPNGVNTTQPLFSVTSGSNGGQYMEITFEYQLNIVGLPAGYSVVTTTLTVGTMGGSAVFGNGYVPQGVNRLQ
jgi:hypothetical protein